MIVANAPAPKSGAGLVLGLRGCAAARQRRAGVESVPVGSGAGRGRRPAPARAGRTDERRGGEAAGVGLAFAATLAWRDSPTLKLLARGATAGAFALAALEAGTAWVRRAGVTRYGSSWRWRPCARAWVRWCRSWTWTGRPCARARPDRAGNGHCPRRRHRAAAAGGVRRAVHGGGRGVPAPGAGRNPDRPGGAGRSHPADRLLRLGRHRLRVRFPDRHASARAVGACAARRDRGPAAPDPRTRSVLGITEVGVALGLLAALFAIFVLLQFPYLFGGAAGGGGHAGADLRRVRAAWLLRAGPRGGADGARAAGGGLAAAARAAARRARLPHDRRRAGRPAGGGDDLCAPAHAALPRGVRPDGGAVLRDVVPDLARPGPALVRRDGAARAPRHVRVRRAGVRLRHRGRAPGDQPGCDHCAHQPRPRARGQGGSTRSTSRIT